MKTLRILVLVTLSTFVRPMYGNCESKMDDTKLAGNIYTILRKHYPRLKTWSGYIADKVSPNAKDFVSLRDEIEKLFSKGDPNLTWLKWSDHESLSRALVGEIASQRSTTDATQSSNPESE